MKSTSIVWITTCLCNVQSFQAPTGTLVSRRSSTFPPRCDVLGMMGTSDDALNEMAQATSNKHSSPAIAVAALSTVLLFPGDLPNLGPPTASASDAIATPTTGVVVERVVSTSTVSSFTTTSSTSKDPVVDSLRPRMEKSVLTMTTPRSGPVMDLAGVLSTQDQVAILQSISRAEAKTKTEIQVILVDRIGTRDKEQVLQSPKQMATALFNLWRIGPAGKNNGVLVLAVLDQRRVEIEVGGGIGDSMNAAWCTNTLQETAVPQFRQGNYGQGILQTVERVSERLATIDRSRRQQEQHQREQLTSKAAIVGMKQEEVDGSISKSSSSVRVEQFMVAAVLAGGIGSLQALNASTQSRLAKKREKEKIRQQRTPIRQEQTSAWIVPGQTGTPLPASVCVGDDISKRARELRARIERDQASTKASRARLQKKRQPSSSSRRVSKRSSSDGWASCNNRGGGWSDDWSGSGGMFDSGGFSDGDGGGADW